MIKSIKLEVTNEDGKYQELCFDYELEVVSIYLGDKFICRMDYSNFKDGIKEMIEKW